MYIIERDRCGENITVMSNDWICCNSCGDNLCVSCAVGCGNAGLCKTWQPAVADALLVNHITPVNERPVLSAQQGVARELPIERCDFCGTPLVAGSCENPNCDGVGGENTARV